MNALKAARTKAGLTIRGLAEKSGVGKDTISRLENYQSTPHAQTLKKLADTLGVPVSKIGEDLALGRERALKESATKDKVEVAVTWEDSLGNLRTEHLRFRGEEIDMLEEGNRGNVTKTLYRCPDGFRVLVDDAESGRTSLHPNRPSPYNANETDYPTYSGEELVQDFPEFGDEDLVGAVRIRDLD
jgi:transcriptional regulator with XRE-family HTH domain